MTETVEFPVPYSSEECVPLVRCKPKNRTFGVLTVPDTDLTTWQVCHFNAVTVREAEGALNPVRAALSSRAVSKGRSFHVLTSCMSCEFLLRPATTERTLATTEGAHRLNGGHRRASGASDYERDYWVSGRHRRQHGQDTPRTRPVACDHVTVSRVTRKYGADLAAQRDRYGSAPSSCTVSRRLEGSLAA